MKENVLICKIIKDLSTNQVQIFDATIRNSSIENEMLFTLLPTDISSAINNKDLMATSPRF